MNESALPLAAVLLGVGLLPFAFMSATAFVKIATVLHVVRSAIGVNGVPSGTVITALAGSLTLIAMAPVGSRIAERADPLWKRPVHIELVREWVDAVREPMREFFLKTASAQEKARFFELSRNARDLHDRENVHESDLTVLVPAFLVTELTDACAVGFLLFLPFFVIDWVVANVLVALGMTMLNPAQMALPFKLLLFVAIDGWGLLSQSLVAGYIQ